ncbi:MAG: ABC transporter ATP-binding protein [Caldilineaceae bacterium]|nr:ABC transporter ATP-binding protein [Caldilineaceae bacterium]
MLNVDHLRATYGSITALRDISIEVNQGELVALIGVNGAGKSTTLLSIAGVVKPVAGTIMFEGESLLGQTPEAILRRGVALVPEGRRILAGLTVAENLRLGAAIRTDRSEIDADMEAMCQRFPILGQRFRQAGGTLSGGEQQQLAIARALMSRPKLLMLDEPSLGLAPILVDGVFELISELRARGTTILLVEQNVERTLEIADRAYLLNTGRIEHAGTPAELREHVDLAASYLGM